MRCVSVLCSILYVEKRNKIDSLRRFVSSIVYKTRDVENEANDYSV